MPCRSSLSKQGSATAQKGEPLLEVEGDKVNVEVESSADD